MVQPVKALLELPPGFHQLAGAALHIVVQHLPDGIVEPMGAVFYLGPVLPAVQYPPLCDFDREPVGALVNQLHIVPVQGFQQAGKRRRMQVHYVFLDIVIDGAVVQPFGHIVEELRIPTVHHHLIKADIIEHRFHRHHITCVLR